MARRRRKSKKGTLAGGLALEIATLAAMLLLAQPGWISEGLAFLQQPDTTSVVSPVEPDANSNASTNPAPPASGPATPAADWTAKPRINTTLALPSTTRVLPPELTSRPTRFATSPAAGRMTF